MTSENIKKSIKNFIAEEFLDQVRDISDEEPLFDSGMIDSLGMIKLTTFLNNNFGVVINPSEVTADNFNTVNKIVKFINKKK